MEEDLVDDLVYDAYCKTNNSLINFINFIYRAMEKWGFGLSRSEIMVGDFVTTNNIKTPFKNEIPEEDLFLNFKNRHNLSIKKTQSVKYNRKKSINPFIIYAYFDLLSKTLDELELYDKPSQVWNLDETSFCLDPSKKK